MKFTDMELAGRQFGRLSVLYRINRTEWACICGCGNRIVTDVYKLKSGNTKSCGCLSRDLARQRHLKHEKTLSPEYVAYQHAKARCTNPNDSGYENYGGRGIKFCFESFEKFFAEVGPRPSSAHSLDRIDVDGHYEKGNLRWATRFIQSLNRRYLPSSSSGFLGVKENKRNGRWEARISANGRSYHLGTFATPLEAARAYDSAARKHHGKLAKLNFPDEVAA